MCVAVRAASATSVAEFVFDDGDFFPVGSLDFDLVELPCVAQCLYLEFGWPVIDVIDGYRLGLPCVTF